MPSFGKMASLILLVLRGFVREHLVYPNVLCGEINLDFSKFEKIKNGMNAG